MRIPILLLLLLAACEPAPPTLVGRGGFELLRAAYVKARYSKHYKITAEELAWLTERVEVLKQLVIDLCTERLAELRGRSEAA